MTNTLNLIARWPSAAASAITPTETLASDRRSGVLPILAMTLGAEDIVVVAQLPRYSGYVVVHAGSKCLDVGIGWETLSPMLTQNAFNGKPSQTHWINPPVAGSQNGFLVSTLKGSNDELFVVGLLYKVRPVDERDRFEADFNKSHQLLLPVIELCLQTVQLQTRLDGAYAALDHSDLGIILLTANGDVVHENTTARRLLEDGAGIQRRGKSVAATNLADAVRLRVAIDHVLSTNSSAGSKNRVPLFALHRQKGQRPLLAAILPTHTQSEAADAVSMMMFLCDPEHEIGNLLQSACRLYDLSPVETALSCHLARGVSIAEAAAALKIKELTARGYLKQIFIKTGVNRQAALVQLLLSSVIRLGDDTELAVL